MTPERGGSVAAEAEANSRVSPLTRRRPPACQRAWPLSISASSTSTTERRRHAGAGFVAFAQQVGDVADLRVGLFVGGDLPRRRRGGDAAALADQQGGDDTGVRRFGGGQFEDDPLPFFSGGGGGQGVEEGLLFGLAQGGKPVERGEGGGRQMGAAW